MGYVTRDNGKDSYYAVGFFAPSTAEGILLPNPTTPVQETRQPERIILTEAQEYPSLTEEVKAILEPAHVQRPSNAVVDVEVLVLPPESAKVFVEAIAKPPEPNEALRSAAQRYKNIYLTMETT